MILLLSPAKKLDTSRPCHEEITSSPRFLEKSEELITGLRALSVEDVKDLMHLSDKLAELNYQRYIDWNPSHDASTSTQAIFTFSGDVYQGMDLEAWSEENLQEAQLRLRILSGLYGLLRPMDFIQPHRLEMGTKFQNAAGKDLYAFWGEQITELINEDLKAANSNLIINLASNEYFSSVKKKNLNGTLCTPIFKDEKNGKYKIISFYAKKARGMMADFIIRNDIKELEELKKFNQAGYVFSEQDSTADTLVFKRPE